MITDYIKYLLKSKNEHSLHSPFLFDFYIKILKDKSIYPAYNAIESLRKELLKDQRQINITDYGAGSKHNSDNKRKVKDIARRSQKRPKLAKLFFRIIQFNAYKNIIDLGTSLGLTTSYLAINNTDSKILSFEGCLETAKIAQENFDKLSLKNINIVVGNIDETLPQELENISTIDFAFFDANHRFEPTMRYFNQCIPKINDNSCFIFDDIYWSNEMKQAWKVIKDHSSVSVSIDLFWVGIVFFRKKQPKQAFVLKF